VIDVSGNWNNGVYAGTRTVNANNYPWNVNTNIGCRLACDNFFIAKIKNVGVITVTSAVAIRKEHRQIDHPLLSDGRK
jgi:hypothetical protein